MAAATDLLRRIRRRAAGGLRDRGRAGGRVSVVVTGPPPGAGADAAGVPRTVEESLVPLLACREVGEVLLAGPGVPARLPADHRVRVVDAGTATTADPGVAAGLAARGDLVTFVEAGDVVPRDGLAALVRTLDRSDADAAVGPGVEVRGGRRLRASWAEGLTTEGPAAGAGARLEAVAGVLAGPLPAGVLFRSAAWREAAGTAAAETAAAGAAALVAARGLAHAQRLEVVDEVVHERHDRQASLPVTRQDRFRAAALRERVAGWAAVTAGLTGEREPVRDAWLVALLTHLVPPVAHDAVAAGEDAVAVLRAGLPALLAAASDEVLARVPLPARLASVAAAGSGRTELGVLLDHLSDHSHGLPTQRLPDGGLVAVLPEAGPVPPDGVRRVRDVDRVLRSRVTSVHGGSRSEVTGAAFVTYDPPVVPELEVRDPRGRLVPTGPVEPVVDPDLEEWAARGHEDRAGCGFRAALPDGSAVDETPGAWTVTVRVAGHEAVHRVEPGAARSAAADVLVTGVQVDGDDVVLCLEGPSAARVAGARLAGGKATVASTRTAPPSGPGPAEVRLGLRHDLFGEPALLPAGRYDLELHASGGSAGGLLEAATAPDAGPRETLTDRLRVALAPAGAGDRPRLLVGAPLDAATRSVRGQRRLLDATYAPARRRSRAGRTVLVESFRGRSAGDNPGAVARALLARDRDGGLGLDVAVVVDDPSVTVPAGARAVVRRSPGWYDAMGGAAAYVSNAGAPYWFEKAEGQLHVQTWHGTPLKRIGEDRGPGDFDTWRHRRHLAAQAAGWDVMVSSGPFVSGVYRGAFGFTGPVLEVGYPRNDVLLDAGAGERRTAVRGRLGLGPDRRVVLYAPTWRDHLGVRDAKPLFLDAERLVAALPEAVVLLRGHYNSTRQDDVFVGHPRVRDVTRYPEIADLFLAADALVTDYSSVMFDFALTDRPQVLLVPDLERYRDAERGFYLDLDRHHPGPLATTTDEVVDVLAGPDRHATARAAFRRDFCALEDGTAADRVADHVLRRL